MSKSVVYAITIVICLLLQVGLAPAIQIAGCSPNFLLIPVMLISLNSGVGPGSITGFLCGLFEDFAGSNTIGCMALIMVLLAVVLGAISSAVETQPPLVTCVIVLCACLFTEVGYGVSVILSNPESNGVMATLVGHSLPTALYTTVFGCLALVTIGLVLVDNSPVGGRLGGSLGGSPGKMPRMKSRLK